MAQRNDVIPYSEAVAMVRAAIEDRAAWFDYLTKEALAAGADPEVVARRAIQKFGFMKSSKKMEQTSSMEEFVKQFAGELVAHVFEMDVVKLENDEAEVHLHYCPLVESWKKNGNSPEEINTMCEWVTEGDYGMMQNFPDFEFSPVKRIAAGDAYCRFLFTRKEKEKEM